MKKFLAFLMCAVTALTFVGCGKKSAELELGDYAYADGDDTYMPTVILMDDDRFQISYKGYIAGNQSGTYVYDKDKNSLTCTTENGGEIYFEVDGDTLVYRAITPTALSVVNEEYNGFRSDVRDTTRFSHQDYDENSDEEDEN